MGANKGLIGSSLFINAPVTSDAKAGASLADFKGLKIRILSSDFQIEQIKRLGATPVAMSLGDVMPALQQGAIDGHSLRSPRLRRCISTTRRNT